MLRRARLLKYVTLCMLLGVGTATVLADDAQPATIIVYRTSANFAVARTATIICDGTPIADLSQNKYVTLKLKPGSHVIGSTWNSYTATVTVAAGSPSFVEYSPTPTGPKAGAGPESSEVKIELVCHPSSELKFRTFLMKMKPVDPKKIRDSSVAFSEAFQ
jgi:hypothetical protein